MIRNWYRLVLIFWVALSMPLSLLVSLWGELSLDWVPHLFTAPIGSVDDWLPRLIVLVCVFAPLFLLPFGVRWKHMRGRADKKNW